MIYTFTNAKVYLSTGFQQTNITIQDNAIIQIGSAVLGTEIKLSSTCIIVPSFIDLHAHFREPGQTEKEDLVSGALSGLYGGYQTVCVMANTSPVIDHPTVLAPLLMKAKKLPINIQFFSAITNNLAGQKAVDFASFGEDVIGFSDDGIYLTNQDLLLTALKYGQTNNKLVSLHVDNRQELSPSTIVLNQTVAARFNLTGVDENYETGPLRRDLAIVNQLQLRYHLCHLSTAKSVALVRKSKAINPFLTCEVTPHHLTLSTDDILINDGNYLMNPPLNLKSDQLSLIAALNDGTIDVIATDHAPHQAKEKELFVTSAMGIIGLQLTFPLLYTKLVQPQKVPLATIINALTVNPQKLIQHHDVQLKVNNQANFTVIDLALTQTVTSKLLKSKATNTPFLGTALTGWPIMNIHNGIIHHLNEEGA
ncbi:dihydroorotase [Spiroplasma sp. NBRC 100390]|uniref:dihydroorotase n=1 Tax=unclassified Spiroplasma TaxID=2637901 RepID=UPI0008928346|nr:MULTISPECIES: dihydroorotase [unclassified Spiroplasma]AOX44024.1 dihydroorotase [Spiroplasma sp. TU-14]APE13494.1 dihydroorotase [Spiroplasma sp. NBRC 100390]